VPAIVLESAIGSQYEDSPTAYQFPSQYLKHFVGAGGPEPLFAVLYEPRGNAGTGRMKYVAWAEIAGPPVQIGRAATSGRPLFTVYYTGSATPFDNPVPREVLGEPIETWLREIPHGRARNVATVGRAVRSLSDEDFQRIIELSGADLVPATYPVGNEHEAPLVAARERSEVLVSMLKRTALFRRQVITAYNERCAVSGFGLGRVPVSKAGGLLDAAHIRPVALAGSDDITNGLPLTPTLHRLFDIGLFSVRYADGVPELVVSPHLERTMITSSDGSFRLDLRDGLRLNLPADRRAWPSADQLRFHQNHVFMAGDRPSA
jgi:putative restriction endonuclease